MTNMVPTAGMSTGGAGHWADRYCQAEPGSATGASPPACALLDGAVGGGNPLRAASIQTAVGARQALMGALGAERRKNIPRFVSDLKGRVSDGGLLRSSDYAGRRSGGTISAQPLADRWVQASVDAANRFWDISCGEQAALALGRSWPGPSVRPLQRFFPGEQKSKEEQTLAPAARRDSPVLPARWEKTDRGLQSRLPASNWPTESQERASTGSRKLVAPSWRRI